jgi:predicted nucleic-acid-binding protein
MLIILNRFLTIEQLLQNEIQDAKRWIEVEKEESTYKRNLVKRIELINWVLENMKDSDKDICSIIETKMNEITFKINKTDSIIEADPLDSELRILDWIFFQVCKDQQKKLGINL